VTVMHHVLAKRGFTFVELLVVLAIMVVLIAILLPCVSRARQQAETVQCTSNLRQVGMALLIYADEPDGCLFPDHMGWDSDHVGPVYPDDGSPGEFHDVWPLVVFNVWNPPILLCPADQQPAGQHSYILNEHMSYYNEKYGRPLPAHRSPSDVVLMGEKTSDVPDYYMEYGDFVQGKVDKFRHGLHVGSNYLMLDMHVETSIVTPLNSEQLLDPWDFGNGTPPTVAGRAKTSQRGALKTGQCFDDAYTSSV